MWIGTCPKCNTTFDTGGPTPYGVLCPVCREMGYSLVGVVYGTYEHDYSELVPFTTA